MNSYVGSVAIRLKVDLLNVVATSSRYVYARQDQFALTAVTKASMASKRTKMSVSEASGSGVVFTIATWDLRVATSSNAVPHQGVGGITSAKQRALTGATIGVRTVGAYLGGG